MRRDAAAAAARPRRRHPRGPCTTATRWAPAPTPRASPSTRQPGVEVAGPRRAGLRRAARGHRAGLRGDGERHRVRAGRRHRRGPVVHPRRDPGAVGPTSRAGTSARRSASPAPRWSTRPAGEIFAVADELVNGRPPTSWSGSNIYTGTVDLGQAVNPPGQDPADILQRTGLNLRRQRGLRLRRQRRRLRDVQRLGRLRARGRRDAGYYQAVPIGHDGAVWMGGAAPEVDAAGNIWVTTGNGSSSTPYDYSDSVLELSPGLARTQYFAPSTWSVRQRRRPRPRVEPARAARQRDRPAGGQVVDRLPAEPGLARRDRRPDRLPIGACGSDSDGGDAISGTVVYVPCEQRGARRCRPARSRTPGRPRRGARPSDHGRRARLVDRRVARSTG